MNFLFFSFVVFLYQSTTLSSRTVVSIRCAPGGPVVGKASTNGIEISPTPS